MLTAMSFDVIIFDIDNVLIDTRASYTDCIRKTVETYLEKVLNFRPSRTSLLTRNDVETFKSLGGFNDDWDTCYGFLLYFLQLKIPKRTINDLRKQKDIPALLRSVKTKPFGIKGIEKCFPKQKSVTLFKIAGLFQRFYLTDFVWNEKLLIAKSHLKQLKRAGCQLAIVTGRNREEASFALRRFQIDSLIDAMITTDETPKHLKKPNPYGLLKVASKLGGKLRYLYVGDLPDDMLAAKRAAGKMNVLAGGFLGTSSRPKEMKRELKKAGANFVREQVGELLEKIIPPTRRSI
ncbi:MAG: HAD-IA family hydrolase [Candidatus Omnitrophica bacterium]|nr:HAD-IA family hydrolase [Candidatus Omnitrophota bacterium]